MINFLKYKNFYFLLSIVVIVVGWYSVFTQNLKFSIDFTGGSTLRYQISKDVSPDIFSPMIEKNGVKIQSFRKEGNQYIFQTTPLNEQEEAAVRNEISKKAKTKVTLLQYETVGPTLGRETIRKTIIASLVAILGILVYLTFAFKKFKYAVAAVLAMLHDLLVLIGTYVLITHFFDAQIDTLFVTALLTTLSFSVHDTIVVFDKIREYRRTTSMSLEDVTNQALTDTMVRSLNNSLTIMLMLVPLMLFGGETIRFFAAALLIGTITGTYSSPFIATPVLVLLEAEKRKK
jgi:preprotein translocase subunit SecF